MQRIYIEFYSDNYYIVTSWNEWMTDSCEMIVSNSYSSSISLTHNIHVFFCVFFGILSSITMNSSSDISLCTEECSFIDCFRNGHGGAIYFYQGLNCVINKVCAYQCNTSINNHGQFCHITVKSGLEHKSISYLMSVCKCAQYENTERFHSIRFDCGNLSLNNVNSSANICGYYSGVRFCSPSISNIKQSTFSNNTDDYSRCIGFVELSHHMSQCNIIGNHQKLSEYGTLTVFNYANTLLSQCILDMNTGTQKIFFIHSGSGALQNCYIQSNMQTYGNVNIQSPMSVYNTFIFNNSYSFICFGFQNDMNTVSSNNNIFYTRNLFKLSYIFIYLILNS